VPVISGAQIEKKQWHMGKFALQQRLFCWFTFQLRACLSTQDRLTESLQRSNAYFICCLLPRHTAAIHKLLTLAVDNSRSLHMLLLRRQLRGFHLLDALLVQKQGCQFVLSQPSLYIPFCAFCVLKL